MKSSGMPGERESQDKLESECRKGNNEEMGEEGKTGDPNDGNEKKCLFTRLSCTRERKKGCLEKRRRAKSYKAREPPCLLGGLDPVLVLCGLKRP